MTGKPEFYNEVVDYFLRFGFGDFAVANVAFDIHVEEGRNPAQAHRRAVLLLDRRKIRKIRPLYGFARRPGGTGNIVTVTLRHRFKFAQSRDLTTVFFHRADIAFAHIERGKIFAVRFFIFDQPIDAVKRDPTIIADYSSSAVRVRKSR